VSTHHAARRTFLKNAGAVGLTALTIGFDLTAPARRAYALAPLDAAHPPFAPNAFVRIGTDDSITVISKHLEMGQGSYTGLATILAEELDADWARVRVESAPADAKLYNNFVFGTAQGTGGSSSINNSWPQLREAGAKARAMLIAAAAARWHVAPQELTADKSVVYHAASKRQATYGSLVESAAALPIPAAVQLKDPKDFQLIGKPTTRVDVPAKCDGTAQFTLDVAMPGMLVALLQRPPLFGATVKSFDDSATSRVDGVVKVVQVPRGVAVVARNFWAAKRGRDALKVEWDLSKAEKRSSAAIMEEYRRVADRPAASARKQGNVAQAFKDSARQVTAAFEFPYLAHAPMEPCDAVVKLDAKRCEIWAGDQFQTADQANAAAAAGIDPGQVSIHTLYAGGSFGRRANFGSDYIVEAVSIAKACGADGTPIKLQWTREDDIHGGLYRPMYFHKMEAALSADNKLTAWRHLIVGQSIMAGTPMGGAPGSIDPTSVEGAATIAYAIPNIAVDLDHHDRRAGTLVARGGQLAHHVRRRNLHRRGGARGRGRSAGIPPTAAHWQPTPESRTRVGGAEGWMDCRASPQRLGPWHRGCGSFQDFRCAGRGSERGRRRRHQGRTRRVRGGLRYRDQSRHHCGANGRRHRFRARRSALWRHHAQRRARRAEQFQRLPGPAYE